VDDELQLTPSAGACALLGAARPEQAAAYDADRAAHGALAQVGVHGRRVVAASADEERAAVGGDGCVRGARG
jgi:hypothetical protein